LSQPGQYAAEETVTLIGPSGRLAGVRVLGPERSADQVEISRTDEFLLGVDAPVRASGDVRNTPGLLLEGPAGQWRLAEGVICAHRHIHMSPADAAHFGVRDGDRVDVKVSSQGRELVFGDVQIRVDPAFRLEMHVDTDEANAAGLAAGGDGELVAIEATATWARSG
jgi:acetate kinase